jgi:hypothetical protein
MQQSGQQINKAKPNDAKRALVRRNFASAAGNMPWGTSTGKGR